MTTDIIQNIKDVAHRISENYLLMGESVNNALVASYLDGEIENEEVLKRICEHINQNVYLSLFNDASVNKSNITFEIADYKTVLPIIKESEKAMNDLNASPKDYRNSLSDAVVPKTPVAPVAAPTTTTNPEGEASDDYSGNFEHTIEKAASLYQATQFRTSVNDFLHKISSLRCSEEQVAEKAFDKMAHDARILVARGDSLGDISKIASRHIKDIGGDFIKVAQAYNMIHKDLVDSNYHVNTEFTKISSMKINNDAELLKPVKEFSLSMAKIAGFIEMERNISKTLTAFDRIIKKEIK